MLPLKKAVMRRRREEMDRMGMSQRDTNETSSFR
jgi:hypothetical protein